MSLDATAVREALVDLLAEINGNVTSYREPPHNAFQLPALIVYPPDSIRYRIMKDTDLAVVPVMLLVGPQDPTAWRVLEAFMSGTGSLSVRSKLYSNPTLDGLVSNMKLLEMNAGVYNVGTGPDDSAIGAEFRIQITA